MTPADYTALGCAIRDARRAAGLTHHALGTAIAQRDLQRGYMLRDLFAAAEQGLGYTPIRAKTLADHVDAIANTTRITPHERVRWYVLAGLLVASSTEYREPAPPAPVPTRVLVHNSTTDSLVALRDAAKQAWPRARRIVISLTSNEDDVHEMLSIRGIAEDATLNMASPAFRTESFAVCAQQAHGWFQSGGAWAQRKGA